MTLTLLLNTTLLALFATLLLIIFFFRSHPYPISPSRGPGAPRQPRTEPAHVLLVLGSGGHTAEMLSMLHSLPARYAHRTYVISGGDGFSTQKAEEFETTLSHGAEGSSARERAITSAGRNGEGAGSGVRRRGRGGRNNEMGGGKEEGEVEEAETRGGRTEHGAAGAPGDGSAGGGWYVIYTVPRARAIHQPLLTTPLSCLRCLVACTRLLVAPARGRPDLVLVNGPATALIMVIAVRLVRGWVWLRALRPSGNKAVRAGSGSRRNVTRHEKDDRRSESEGRGVGESRDGRQCGGQRERAATLEIDGAMLTIYIESWARVRTPSLSLKIIVWLRLCDRVLVQHRALAEKGWGEWRGDLMI